MLLLENLGILILEEVWAKPASNQEVDGIPAQRSDRKDGQKNGEIEGMLARMGKYSGRKQKRVTGQKGSDDQPRFAKQDEEEHAVGPNCSKVVDEPSDLLIGMQDGIEKVLPKVGVRLQWNLLRSEKTGNLL